MVECFDYTAVCREIYTICMFALKECGFKNAKTTQVSPKPLEFRYKPLIYKR